MKRRGGTRRGGVCCVRAVWKSAMCILLGPSLHNWLFYFAGVSDRLVNWYDDTLRADGHHRFPSNVQLGCRRRSGLVQAGVCSTQRLRLPDDKTWTLPSTRRSG